MTLLTTRVAGRPLLFFLKLDRGEGMVDSIFSRGCQVAISQVVTQKLSGISMRRPCLILRGDLISKSVSGGSKECHRIVGESTDRLIGFLADGAEALEFPD